MTEADGKPVRIPPSILAKGRQKDYPVVTISGKYGRATINENAWQVLGRPSAVFVQWNATAFRLVIWAAPADHPNAYKLRQTTPESKTRSFSARKFLTESGLRFQHTQQWRATSVAPSPPDAKAPMPPGIIVQMEDPNQVDEMPF